MLTRGARAGELQLENDNAGAVGGEGAPSVAEGLEVSEQLSAPLMTVCRVAGVSRSAACEQRRRRSVSASARAKVGPGRGDADGELLAEIRRRAHALVMAVEYAVVSTSELCEYGRDDAVP